MRASSAFKYSALCFLLSMLATGAGAQTVGGRIGVNRARHSGGSASKTGVVLGGYLVFTLHPSVIVQPELHYSQKGSTTSRPLGFTTIDGRTFLTEAHSDLTVAYLDLPVLAGLRVPLSARSELHFVAGPSASLLVSCRVSVGFRTFDPFTLEALPQPPEESVDCDPQLKNTDVGLVLGGGFGLTVARIALTLDLRYHLGLTDIAGGAVETKNRVVAVTVGAGFRQ